MKLYSQNRELKAIKSIATSISSRKDTDMVLNDATSVSAFLMASLDESYFHFEPTKAAYKRLQVVAQKRSRILSYDELLEDPALNEEYRDVLREYTKKSIREVEDAVLLLDHLDEYRKTRALYHMAKDIIDTLKKPEVDVDKLIDNVTNQLTLTRSRESMKDAVLSVGKDGNALDLVKEALSLEDDLLLKTGITEFDERNGGLPAEGVFLMAATTSGGKSAVRMNLMKNMYYLNKIDVGTVSLEMNAKKETRRLLSNLTGIPLWKFNKKKLSDAERKQCRVAWKKFHKYGVEHGCRYSLMCPTRGMTISQLLMLMKPYRFKVLAIDYISLLDGVDAQDQWKVLSAITRECKVFSSETKCLVILLAQLDSDDDRIRYSKGILEHCDASWTWNYSKPEQRDLKVLPIQQKKARDQELFPFELKENFECMQVFNMDDKGSSKEDAPDPLTDPDIDYDHNVVE